MRKGALAAIAVVIGALSTWQAGAGSAVGAGVGAAEALHYTADNKMIRPADYREWIWLSSGLGMSYSPAAGQNPHPEFDNVFVSRPAYQAFTATGRWPDRTVFILENRQSENKGSINQSGHYQSELDSVEAHVKDEKRFKGKWAFFSFGKYNKTASAIPASAECYSCHAQHAAVDTTFVQFYPTLLKIAKAKNTLGNY